LDVAIAEALELSEAEAVAYIAEFEKHGLIEKVPHKSQQRNTFLVWRCTGVTDREECSELK
jgi:DNA-binding MarR family transcriptional regulator